MGVNDDMTIQLVTNNDGFRCAQAAPHPAAARLGIAGWGGTSGWENDAGRSGSVMSSEITVGYQ